MLSGVRRAETSMIEDNYNNDRANEGTHTMLQCEKA